MIEIFITCILIIIVSVSWFSRLHCFLKKNKTILSPCTTKFDHNIVNILLINKVIVDILLN